MELETIEDQGSEAFWKHIPYTKNPYEETSEKYDAWYSGWYRAHQYAEYLNQDF